MCLGQANSKSLIMFTLTAPPGVIRKIRRVVPEPIIAAIVVVAVTAVTIARVEMVEAATAETVVTVLVAAVPEAI